MPSLRYRMKYCRVAILRAQYLMQKPLKFGLHHPPPKKKIPSEQTMWKALGWLCVISVFSSVVSFAVLALVNPPENEAKALYFAVGSLVFVLVLSFSGILDERE
jgi:hypothetical protein